MSKAKAEADARWRKKAYDSILFRIRKDADITCDAIRSYAESRGESVNSFLMRAVTETMERDKERIE